MRVKIITNYSSKSKFLPKKYEMSNFGVRDFLSDFLKNLLKAFKICL